MTQFTSCIVQSSSPLGAGEDDAADALPADPLGVRGGWSAAAEDKLAPLPPMALPLAPGELEKETRPTPMSRMVSAKCTLLLARLRLPWVVSAARAPLPWAGGANKDGLATAVFRGALLLLLHSWLVHPGCCERC